MHDCKRILTNEMPASACSNPCFFFVLLSTFFAAESFYSYQKQSFLCPHLLIAGQRSARSPEPGVSHELASYNLVQCRGQTLKRAPSIFQCINDYIESLTGMDEFNLKDHSRYFPLKAQVTKQILSSETEQMIIYKTWQRMKKHLLVETPWKKLPNTPSSIYKAPLCLLMTGSLYRLIL